MLIETPEVFLYGEAVGDLSEESLIVLHGGPGAGFDYLRPHMDFLKELRPNGSLLYYDQRGTKRSYLKNHAYPLDHIAHIRDLNYLQKTIFLDKPISLVGYSWGGLLALLYALTYKEQVRRMILISPAPTKYSYRLETKNRLEQSFLRPSVLDMKTYFDLHQQSWSPEGISRYRFALAVSGYFHDPQRALDMTPFKVQKNVEDAVWGGLGSYDLMDSLSSLKHIPTLVVHGQQDAIPLQSAHETAKALEATFVQCDPCGHVPFIEDPKTLWSSCEKFLKT